MEKLIELLNQFEEEKAKYGNQYCNWQYIGGRPICTTSFDMNKIVQFSDLLIISKEYEFIKWLVDNDKIDFEPIMKKEIGYWRNVEGVRGYETYNLENALLMLLSISDKPIEDLISYLK